MLPEARDAAYLLDMLKAARWVSDTFRNAHPEISWRSIIAQRNVLIHEYDDISWDEIWEVAAVHIPRLVDQLAPLIPPLPPEIE